MALSSGTNRPRSSAMRSPTPAAANRAPSAASICGRTAAQPTRSMRRRASWAGARTGWRSITTATTTAIVAEKPSAMRERFFGSTSGEPVAACDLSARVVTSVHAGTRRAGTNRRFFQRCADARRASAVVERGSPRPRPPRPATRTRTMTRHPFTKSGRREPKRSEIAYAPQKIVFCQRFGFVRSRRLRTATTLTTIPASR